MRPSAAITELMLTVLQSLHTEQTTLLSVIKGFAVLAVTGLMKQIGFVPDILMWTITDQIQKLTIQTNEYILSSNHPYGEVSRI